MLKMIKIFPGLTTLALLLPVFLAGPVHADETDNPAPKLKKYTNKEDNRACFKCHGRQMYELVDKESGNKYRHKMPREYIIDSNAFYESNHWNFKCFDCHSDAYSETPHKPELKFQTLPNCVDCHVGDENSAKYNFEKIESEFKESVHATRHENEFTCYSCHNPHTYKINARNKNQNVSQTISYDNAICLNCHANFEKYQLIRDTLNPNIIQKHDWLPNQATHFKNVRCIECHAAYNDSLLVAHKVQPKSKAVKNCVACHSANSMLMKSLYKYKLKETRQQQGFLNANLLSETYVTGANRNVLLNIISLVILIIAFTGIAVHVFFRIRK